MGGRHPNLVGCLTGVVPELVQFDGDHSEGRLRHHFRYLGLRDAVVAAVRDSLPPWDNRVEKWFGGELQCKRKFQNKIAGKKPSYVFDRLVNPWPT